MSYNGSGTYNAINVPVVYGTTIDETAFNETINDIATALTDCVTRDGQSPATANLPMGTFKLTGLGAGAALTDSPNLGQVQNQAYIWCGTSGGSANAQTLTPSPSITAYAAGQSFRFIAGYTSNSSVTLAISGLSTIAVQINAAALVSGEIVTGQIYEVILDTTSTAQLWHVGRPAVADLATLATTATLATLATTATLATLATTATNLNNVAAPSMPSIGISQAGGALTFSMAAQYLAFRNTTLNNGAPTVVNFAPSNLVLPSGGTLGFPTTVQGTIAVLALSTGDIAVGALVGGVDISERGVISTTAIGAGSTAANVFYSTVARTNVAYKVVGSADAVNTAGAWASPVAVVGAGGNALTAMSSLGYGQTWQAVTRTSGTTYYNTTGKPISVFGQATLLSSETISLTVGGVLVSYYGSGTVSSQGSVNGIVPVGQSYVITVTGATLNAVNELR